MMFCNVLLCDSFMVLYFTDFHVKLLFLHWFHFEIKHDFFGKIYIYIYIYIYIKLKKLIWVVAWFYFMISIRYLITIMNVQTFESEQKFNVSLQNHIEPQPSIIVTTSIAYKVISFVFFHWIGMHIRINVL